MSGSDLSFFSFFLFFFFSFFSSFFFISLIADGPHHYHPACGHKGSSHLSPVHALQFWEMDKSGYTHPFSDKVGGGKMQTSSPPVITPNRSQSNPDDMITLPRPIQSVGMDLHDVSGTSTGQTLPRERRAPPGTHFCPTIWWVYPHSATIFILHPLLSDRVGEEDRDHVHASTAYTADDGANRSGRANVHTGAILHLPRGRGDRSPGHVR